MQLKLYFRQFFIIVISAFGYSLLNAKTLDHELFLKEIKNSSDHVYLQCLNKYDEYLEKFPDDIAVHIEKCKFIQFAQYDEYDDYNPNQEAFDSCSSLLASQFPGNPEVLLFQTKYLWGEELKEVFKKAENSVQENSTAWSNEMLGELYLKIANQHYWDKEYLTANKYIHQAIIHDIKHASSLNYARILIALDKKDEALEALIACPDTTSETYELSQKAELFVELKAFSNALELYKRINSIDSTYNNNVKMASTLEGIGEYGFARDYLVADTSKSWNKETALQRLLMHDLKYQDGDVCIETYNQYRDFGYLTDPLGAYRLKLFFAHPMQNWKLRDFLSLFVLAVVILFLAIIPFVWILPIYVVGHKWNFINGNKAFTTIWGLKAFWFVSAGYFIASLLALMADPEYLYSLSESSFSEAELSRERLGLISIYFILFFALFGFATLFKKNLMILFSSLWSFRKSIFTSIGILIVYRILCVSYVRFGITYFGISADDITMSSDFFLTTRQEIEAIIFCAGKFYGFLLICLLVPVYEEIIFRGVILDASHRYFNFTFANIFQSVLFAAIHLNLFLFPAFFIFGIITGYMRKNSGGLLPGIVFHVINNALAISVLLANNFNEI